MSPTVSQTAAFALDGLRDLEWTAQDLGLQRLELTVDDLLRTEESTAPEGGLVWVFTPEFWDGGYLWVRLVERAGVVVISFHKGRFMKPSLTPPNCSRCNAPAALVPKVTRFRRGDRVLPVDGFVWQCPSNCSDPADGSAPYQFSSFELMEWEEARAAEVWRERFGEPMPASRRGRGPDEQRTVRVPVLLTAGEAQRLDSLRGDRPRGEFLRQLLGPPDRRAG